jgi:hypothetical protein
MLVSSSFVFGGKIDCYVQGMPDTIVNTFCLMHGTYTVTNTAPIRQATEDEKNYFEKFGHRGVAHPGIGHSITMNNHYYIVYYYTILLLY